MSAEIAKAVCQVMGTVQAVAETGYNKHQRYAYASDSDLLTALQPAMAEAGLALIPTEVETSTVEHGESKAGNAKWRTDLVVTYSLIHTSGECIRVQAPGCGIDSDDKGVYKAMTGALKYAMRHLFLVPTGDDAERAPKQAPSQPPAPTQATREPYTRPAPMPKQEPWSAEAWTSALVNEAGGKITLNDAIWWCMTQTRSRKHPRDLDTETRRVALEWICSISGVRDIVAAVGGQRRALQSAFFAKWTVVFPTPRKKDGADDEAIATSEEYSAKRRAEVCSAWYGVVSSKDIPISKIIQGDRSIKWMQSVSQADFEVEVDRVLES